MINIASIKNDKGTYGHRALVNGGQLRQWAIENGFSKPLEETDFHCTVAYSHKSFPTDDIKGQTDFLIIPVKDIIGVKELGDKGAIVLSIKSDSLDRTWKQCVDKGASWDYESYQPHITITYHNGAGVDLEKVKLPEFDLVLGNVSFAPVDENYADTRNSEDDNFIIDEDTGIKRPKHIKPKEQPKGVLPSFKNSDYVDIELNPEDWFLTQSTIMACLPVDNQHYVPVELVNYVNSNFNTYPVADMPAYVNDFRQALLLKNHDPSKAYGFALDTKPRAVKVGKHTLQYIDLLTAVNRNIDRDFADKIENETIKYQSWGHTSGDFYCSICGSENEMCKHLSDMVIRNTPTPAILQGKPYGIIHRFTPDFHVYDVSYLDVKPAYDGAVTHKVIKLDKPLRVRVSKDLFYDKAKWAAEDEPISDKDIVKDLLRELKLLK